MSWSLFRWVWQLESPLHVGATSAGNLNRCRLYIPARALWGALTAEVASRNASPFPSYQFVGEQLQKNARFTYLYPAEHIGGVWRAWLPRYEEGKGLVWRREDQQGADNPITDREMRMWLLSTRPGTAIDPQSDTAAEGTLREIECVNIYWRNGDQTPVSRVAMVGYVFLRNGSSSKNELEAIHYITIGGDTRYGLGRLSRMTMAPEQTVFGARVELSVDDPVVHSPTVYAHAISICSPTVSAPSEKLIGSREMLVGWDSASAKGLVSQAKDPLWVPGSTVAQAETAGIKWKVEQKGLWGRVDLNGCLSTR